MRHPAIILASSIFLSAMAAPGAHAGEGGRTDRGPKGSSDRSAGKYRRSVSRATDYRVDEIAKAMRKAVENKDDSESSSSSSSGSSYKSSSSGSSYYSDYKGSSYRSEYSWRDDKPSKPAYKPTVVTAGHETGLGKYDVRVAVLGGAQSQSYSVERDAKALGKLIAKKQWAYLSGGGNGAPHIAQQAAFDEGGMTVGFVQASSLDQHTGSGRPVDSVRVLYATNTGYGSGTIEREAPLVQQANIRTVINGRLGTMGELVASLYEPGVIALFKGTGGVADAAPGILKHIGPLPEHTSIVSERDPEKLMEEATRALDRNVKAKLFPKSLVKPGRQQVFSDPNAKEKFSVFSFLVNDNGMSQGDVEKVRRLAKLVATGKLDDRPKAIVVPHRDGLTDTVADIAVQSGVPTFEISHQEGTRLSDNKGRKLVRLGKGEGVGEFASQREVVQDARVVFVAGGDYKTLGGLIFALHEKTIIAVLETGGMSGALREEIAPHFGKSVDAELIYDSDPVKLLEKVKAAALPKPKIKYKYESDYSSSRYESKRDEKRGDDKRDEKRDEKRGDDKRDEKRGGDDPTLDKLRELWSRHDY